MSIFIFNIKGNTIKLGMLCYGDKIPFTIHLIRSINEGQYPPSHTLLFIEDFMLVEQTDTLVDNNDF